MSSKLDGSPTEQVVEAVNELGLQGAARKFNTSPATLSRWLKAQRFKIKRIYVRAEPPPPDQAQTIEQLLRDQLEKFGLADGAEIIVEDAS